MPLYVLKDERLFPPLLIIEEFWIEQAKNQDTIRRTFKI